MNSNLYLNELKQNRKNLAIWSAIVMGFTLMVTSIFPYMAEMGDSITLMMEKLPVELGKAMGVDAETWSSILGFYSTYYGVYIIVLVSIYSTSTGTAIISKEEKNRTAEFLLTKPISRQNIVVTKLAALYTLTLLIFIVQTLSALIFIRIFTTDSVNWEVFLQMHLSGLVLILFFTAIGVLLSMFVTPKKNFMGLVVGLTFGSYFLNAIGKSANAVSWIANFSPFNYMVISKNPETVFNYTAAAVMLSLVLLFLWVANKIYLKKDIDG